MKITAIVLSAGKGTRMNADVPKQYLNINDKPVIYYCLDAFEKSNVDEVIVVTGAGEENYFKSEIVDRYKFEKVCAIVAGGEFRFNSVYNGLLKCERTDYILIHDGARPCIKPGEINLLISNVIEKKTAVAATPVKDTIKIIDSDSSVKATPPRASLYAVQTPQCFKYSIVKKAYDDMIMSKDLSATDDAMVVEKYSDEKVYLVDIGYDNIKITTPGDLKIAEGILSKNI